LPEAEDAIFSRRAKDLRVGTEGCGPERALMSRPEPDLVAGGPLPKLDEPFWSPCRDPLAVGAQGEGVDRIRMLKGRHLERAGVPTPGAQVHPNGLLQLVGV